jgi:hypothetical protein
MKFKLRRPVLTAILAGIAFQYGLMAQGPKDVPQTPGPKPHDIASFWELRDEPGYGGMAQLHPKPAVLTPEYQKKMAEMREAMQHPKPGAIVGGASRYCTPIGVPFIMGQSPPLDIVQGKDEILIFSEQHSSARHIYIDGRKHPEPADMKLTTDGHSIGHWEGDTLVVDTTGFTDEGFNFVPGGGGRRSTTHMIERFTLIDNGNKLRIQTSWSDPSIFVEAPNYELTFFRSDPTTFAMEEFCDAGDVKQGQSVVVPAQK